MQETVNEPASFHNISSQQSSAKEALSQNIAAEISEDEADTEMAEEAGTGNSQNGAVSEENSPSSEGGELVVAMAMNDLLHDAIKQEPGIPLYDRSREGSVASRTSFVSTEETEPADRGSRRRDVRINGQSGSISQVMNSIGLESRQSQVYHSATHSKRILLFSFLAIYKIFCLTFTISEIPIKLPVENFLPILTRAWS